MSARIKNGLKTWMLMYLGVCAALLAAGAAGEPAGATLPADTLPERFIAKKRFFLPPHASAQRDDI